MGFNSTWYTLPNGSDTRDFLMFFNYVNVQAEGIFMPLMLLAIWVITFLAGFTVGGGVGSAKAARGVTFASFFTSILGILLAISGLLATKWMYLPIILTAFGALWLKLEKSRE